jgi:hypothetical protein
MAGISVKLRLRDGVVEIDAPPENFQEAMTAVKEVLELARTLGPSVIGGSDAEMSSKAVEATTVEMSAEGPPPRAEEGGRQRARTRQTGGSSGRVGRLGGFELVDLGLSEEHERRLRKFYSEKNPKEQTHQVAVAMCQGEKELKRKAFQYNEIYTLLRLSGEKDLPRALDVVVSRMAKDNWVTRDKDGISLKFVGRDFVEQSLPMTG